MESLELVTTSRETLIDVTDRLSRLVRENSWRDGLLFVHCPHTTAAVTVNEAADPSVVRDIAANLARFVPRHGDYRHLEGNSDAHIKTSLVGPCLPLIVEAGEIQLGTWQGVFFCEFDGPRTRNLWVKWIAG